MILINVFLSRGNEPDDLDFIYVLLAAAFEADVREVRFGDPLDAELRMAGIGFVSGGGELQSAPDDAGERSIIYCGVDIDTLDLDAARTLLRLNLPELGCPPETCVQFGDTQDRYDGRLGF